MAGMDERQRLENIDLYGAAAFLGDGWLVAKNGSQFFVTAGAGYVRGLRAQLAANQNIVVTTKPVKVWLDVAWTGTLTSAWGVTSKITLAANLSDYVQNGVQHYVFAVASIDANGNITDLRPKGTLNDQSASDALKKHEQSRNHPDATTAAKGFTQLSSATDSVSESVAATPKAVKAAYDLASAKYTAQDATTGQKGIVQLSSSLASTSETQAATPKAIKAVNDELVKVRDSLGTASKADIVTSTDDITPGRVPVVGWKGLGTVRDARAADESVASFWRDLAQVKSGITIPYDGSPTVSYLAVDGANQHAYVGRRKGAEAISWVKLYSEFNKPTAADVGALKLQLSNLNVDLNTLGTQTQAGLYQQQASANATTAHHYPVGEAGSLLVSPSAYGCQQEYTTYASRRKFIRGLTSNFSGNGPWTEWNEIYSEAYPGEISGTSVNNFRIAYGDYGTFWRNDGNNLYLMLTNKGDKFGNYNALRPFRVSLETGAVALGIVNLDKPSINDWTNIDARYYTKAQSDAGYMAKAGAYTKAESDGRYPLKTATVIDVRQGSPGTIVLKRNGWNYVPGGCAFTGWYVEGDAPVDDTIQYKPIQININGAWRTISG